MEVTAMIVDEIVDERAFNTVYGSILVGMIEDNIV